MHSVETVCRCFDVRLPRLIRLIGHHQSRNREEELAIKGCIFFMTLVLLISLDLVSVKFRPFAIWTGRMTDYLLCIRRNCYILGLQGRATRGA
jgi:hypothetical protein